MSSALPANPGYYDRLNALVKELIPPEMHYTAVPVVEDTKKNLLSDANHQFDNAIIDMVSRRMTEILTGDDHKMLFITLGQESLRKAILLAKDADVNVEDRWQPIIDRCNEFAEVEAENIRKGILAQEKARMGVADLETGPRSRT